MEDGVPKLEEYTKGWWQSTWNLTLSASIGGLIFGYDAGLISGASLFVEDDFPFFDNKSRLLENMVIKAIIGAIFGAAIGGWVNDKYGRRTSIFVADLLCVAGSVIMALAPVPRVLITGRILMGFGVGMLSVTSPLYISEASPPKIRGALVGTNSLLFAVGQFLFYLTNLLLSKAPGTWRWLVGVVGIPALIQFILMLFFAESPSWLYRKNKNEETVDILWKIYNPHELDTEEALLSSVEHEVADESSLIDASLIRALIVGIILQSVQSFSGIEVVMYYSTTIVQLAGFASMKMDLALPLITSVLGIVGSLVTITFVDKFGRKNMLLLSMCGTLLGLFALCHVFMSPSIPIIGIVEESSTHFDVNSTCLSNRMTAPDAASFQSCMACCGFCANIVDQDNLGACLISIPIERSECIPSVRSGRKLPGLQEQEHHLWYTNGCPSRYGYLALLWLGAYIIFYSMGTATIPWILNSEIYPLRYRGICGGLIVAIHWFWSLSSSLGLSFSEAQEVSPIFYFLLFGLSSILAVILIFGCVPETKGLSLEEVEKMLERIAKLYAERIRQQHAWRTWM